MTLDYSDPLTWVGAGIAALVLFRILRFWVKWLVIVPVVGGCVVLAVLWAAGRIPPEWTNLR